MGVRKISNSKGHQGHTSSLVLAPFNKPYMIFYLSSIATMSLSRIILRCDHSYFPKFKKATEPWP